MPAGEVRRPVSLTIGEPLAGYDTVKESPGTTYPGQEKLIPADDRKDITTPPDEKQLPVPLEGWIMPPPLREQIVEDGTTPDPGPNAATSWVTINSEGFEGSWPNGSWTTIDLDGATNGELYWDDESYLHHSGSWSAWAGNGGAQGVDPAAYYYANNMRSWMIYGPFDLSNSSGAELLFHYWNQSELSFDHFYWLASPNGINFYGTATSGDSGGWQFVNLDLANVPNLGSLLGDSSVWIAFVFNSDGSFVDDGPFVDDITLQKNSSTDCSGQYLAEYFNNRSLSGTPAYSRCEGWPINQQWGSGGPGNNIGNDNFSARWTGQANIAAGNYTFTAVADDGVRVWLDNNLIIDGWRDQPPTEYKTTGYVSGGTHTIKMEYYEAGGGATAQFRWDPASPCPTITQWQGEYWNNQSLSGNPVLCRNDGEVNFDWSGGSPHSSVPSDHFSARWTRTLSFNAGRYRFHLAGDDGIRLWVDGNLVIDKWIDQGYSEYTAERDLGAGNHTLKVEYYENGGGAAVRLWWEPADSCPTITQWQGQYWNNQSLSGNPVLCRNDGEVNFDWSGGSPHSSVPSDHFSARWTRTLSLNAGIYRFHLAGDDGIRLWIDGNLLLDKWFDQGYTEYTLTLTLAGGNHTLKVEYYENGGGAAVRLWWELVDSCPTITQWQGQYWNNQSLSGNPVLCRNDGEVNFDWSGGSPHSSVPSDHFSARWTRTLSFNAGRYRFHLAGDDGIRLWIDGNQVIDKWIDQGYSEYTAERDLGAGNHTLKVEYYENGGGAAVRLWWELADSCPTITQWQGQYWNNQSLSGNPVLCRNDGEVNFDWSGGSPHSSVPSDHFSARWTRTLSFNAGRYRFHLAGDDGIRLWIDGNQVIDKWIDQGYSEYTAERDLGAGNHTLKVEYYENGGGAAVRLWWEIAPPPGEPVTLLERDGFYILKIDMWNSRVSTELVMANDSTNVNQTPAPVESVATMAARLNSRNPMVVVNADYFAIDRTHGPEGLTVRNGVRFDGFGANPDDTDGMEWQRSSLSISQSKAVRIGKQTDCTSNCVYWTPDANRFYTTVGGGPLFVESGQRIGGSNSLTPCNNEYFPDNQTYYCQGSYKWSGVGMSENGQFLYLIASPTAKSMDQAAAALIGVGAWRAMKFDGGSSAQLWYQPRGTLVIGNRSIANALVVFVQP